MADSAYSLVLNWNVAGQFASTVLHLNFDDSGYSSTQTAALALINRWDTVNRAAILTMIPGAVSLISIKSRKVSTTGGFEAVKLITTSNVGTLAGPMTVAAIGPVIILIDTAETKLRGKVFLPGTSQNALAEGVWLSSFYSVVAAHVFLFQSSIVLAGGGTPTAHPCVYHRGSNTWSQTKIAYLSSTVGTLRRRQRPS